METEKGLGFGMVETVPAVLDKAEKPVKPLKKSIPQSQ